MLLVELLKKCLSTRSHARQTARCKNWRPIVEPLEDRQLQATALTSSLVEGVLTIQGTNLADRIVVRQSGNTISVGGHKYDSSAVNMVDIDARGGNDFVDLRLSRPTLVMAGSGNDRVQGGGKADSIYGGQGRDILWGGAGDDLIFGEGGVDLLRGGQGDDYLDGGSTNDRVLGGAEDGKAVTDLVRADLAAKLGIAVDAVRGESLAGVAWPDPSLGCPLPPGIYVPAVITPGYRITLKAEETLYEYHTDLKNNFRLCDMDLANPGEEVFSLLRADLAAKLGVTVDVVHVESTSPTFWLETGLDGPSFSTPSLTTRAYRITLTAEGKVFEYHTDLRSRFVLCLEDVADPGEDVLSLLRQAAAAQLSILADTVHVESISRTEWRPGLEADVTAGYRIRLKAGEMLYEYHTDLDNGFLVFENREVHLAQTSASRE